MKILERYLIREVARPLVVVFAVLVLVFGGYSAAEFLGQAASGLLAPKVILLLVILKVAIACEVLLPIAAYLTLVIGLGRLAANHEATAMAFSRFGARRRVLAIARLALVIAGIVGLLSLWIRPLAYRTSFAIRAEAQGRFDLDRLQPGTFFADDEGKRCIFVDESEEGPDAPPRIFVFLDDDERPLALMADRAEREQLAGSEREEMVFHDLDVYQLAGSGENMMVSNEELHLPLPEPDIEQAGQKRKAATTLELFGSSDPKEIGELQWRISRPLSTFLLMMLALVVARGRPRRDRYGRLLLAILCYVAYFQLAALAKNQIEQGQLPALPGIFWVDGLLLVAMLAVTFLPPLFHRRSA